MTAHAAIAAVPKTGTPDRTLLQALLVARVAYIVGSGESPADFDPRGEGGSPVTQVIGYNGLWFWYDESDATTGHDGVTCIVTSANGGRYKVTGVDLLITSVISKTLADPPDPDDEDEELRPADGDAYIVPTGGTWPSGKEKYIAVWVEARREWFYIAPKAGWFVSIAGAARDTVYRYDSVQAAWITGDGSSPDEDSIKLSAIQGVAASLTIRVQNQTTYAPPGSRKTGATPAMPLGGTASNINDNSDSTTAVTSALGDLTGGSVASRIVAKLSLAAATDLITIEARGVLGSASSSSSAMGLYYSTNGGSSWTQAGSGFTLSASAQTIQRNGSFAGVTDIALVTEAKNWASNTHTVAGLNAFDATVTASVGESYIIASPAIGVFAGHENKVAICEVANTFTIYTPVSGDEVYDIALGVRYRYSSISWVSAAGSWIAVATSFAAAAASPSPAGTSAGYSYSATTAPTTSQYRIEDAVTLAHTAKRASAGATDLNLRLKYRCAIDAYTTGSSAALVSANQPGIWAIFRDSETDAIAWGKFNHHYDTTVATLASANVFTDPDYVQFEALVAAPDTSAHTYKIALMPAVFNNGSIDVPRYPSTISRRLLTIEEKA